MGNKNMTIDPVCRMEVGIAEFPLSYMGLEYSFCSQQCHDRFSANPHLYIGHPGSPSPKQHGERIIKRRLLKLDIPVPDEVALKIEGALKDMMGIKEVTIDKNIIRISYDLLEVTTAQIETTIQGAGEKLNGSWGGQLQRAFIHYFEETELDNLEYQQSNNGHHHH